MLVLCEMNFSILTPPIRLELYLNIPICKCNEYLSPWNSSKNLGIYMYCTYPYPITEIRYRYIENTPEQKLFVENVP